jgi:hypothetical protein
MVSIYCIEDCDGLKYVGSTKYTLNERLFYHKLDTNNCSSKQLNLDNCIITELEKCNEENRKERERYWITNIVCINKYKLNFDEKQWRKEYYQKNKEKLNQKRKEYYENNTDKIKEYEKQWREKNKDKLKENQKQYNKKNKDKLKEKRQNKYIEKIVKNCLDDLITKLEDSI